MIIIPSDEVEDTLKNGMDSGIERGLVVSSEIGKKLYEEFNNVKQFGYFPVGVILEDNTLEFLFQRHPKQSKKNRMVEIKMSKEQKIKL